MGCMDEGVLSAHYERQLADARADVGYHKRNAERLADELCGLRDLYEVPPAGEIDGHPELDCIAYRDVVPVTVRYIARERWGQPEISAIYVGKWDLLANDLNKAPTWAYVAAAEDILAREREAEEARADMFEREAA